MASRIVVTRRELVRVITSEVGGVDEEGKKECVAVLKNRLILNECEAVRMVQEGVGSEAERSCDDHRPPRLVPDRRTKVRAYRQPRHTDSQYACHRRFQ